MFKPLLSPNDDPLKSSDFFTRLKFPYLGSPKLDGIRCIVKEGLAFSRSGKILPSQQVQEELTSIDHTDGEIIVGDPTDFGVYNRTQSHVMAFDKPADISLYVFDYTHPDVLNNPFYDRLERASVQVKENRNRQIKFLHHQHLADLDELLAYESFCLEEGYEGIMIRSLLGRYKNGRATVKDDIIFKLKRFNDVEGSIVGFVEQMTNQNEATVDDLGYTERSTAKAGMVPAGTLGKFLVDSEWGVLEVGCGVFTHLERSIIWQRREEFLGKLLKYRFFGHGMKDKPRFPRAVGLRDRIDL